MRLIDLIVSTDKPLVIVMKGRRFSFAGPSSYSASLIDCPIRYVLKDRLQDAIETVISQWLDLLDPADSNLRVPAENMWLEWEDKKARKYGILLASSKSGRSGNIRSFWDNNGEAQVSQISIDFDLDKEAVASQERSYRMIDLRESTLSLDRHLTVSIDHEWHRYFMLNAGPASHAVKRCVDQVISDVYQLFAFARIISSRIRILEDRVDRSRLNLSRGKSKKSPLLDHIELSIDMDKVVRAKGHGLTGRSPSRLHIVRGHLVRKGEKLFWRSTHLRGNSGTGGPIKRTTTIS